MNTLLERTHPIALNHEHVETYVRPRPTRRSRFRSVALQLAVLMLGIIGMAFFLIKFSVFFLSLGAWGYAGVAAVEFASSAMIMLPTPASAYTFAMGALLNPIAVGLIGGTFATLGELVGYYLGRKGSTILPDSPFVRRLKLWTDRWGEVVLFGFAILPVPFDIAGIWAGTVRYPLIRFAPIVLVGKIIKTTAIALTGYFGLETLLRIVG